MLSFSSSVPFQRTHSLFNNILSKLPGSRSPSDVGDRHPPSGPHSPMIEENHLQTARPSTGQNGGTLRWGNMTRDTGDRLGMDEHQRLIVANRNVPADEDDDDWRPPRGLSSRPERRTLPPIQQPLNMARSQALAMAGMSSESYEGTYRPVPEGTSLRLPFAARHRPPNTADRLVGQALGLGRYMDPFVVGAARRELEETYSLDGREMEVAAKSLADQPQYMQHVGCTEIRDFNEYSRSGLLRPTSQQSQESSGSQDDLLLVTIL